LLKETHNRVKLDITDVNTASIFFRKNIQKKVNEQKFVQDAFIDDDN